LPEIIDILRTHTSLDFALYKEGTLLRQIGRRMSIASIKDIGPYLDTIRQDPHEIGRLAKDMLINVTRFFRDEKAFEVLAATILPELISRQPLAMPIRIWDAGCSTGEETYSMAMLFLEAVASAKRNVKLQIFASDVDDDALTIARNGLYAESIAKNVTPARLRRFFTKEDHGYRVTRELREMVVFTAQDLLADAPFSRLDFVSCRNVLIYLRPEVQEKVLSLFHFALREGGILVLGASEAIGDFSERFEPISKKHRIFRHLGRSRPGEVTFPIAPGSRGQLAYSPARSVELAPPRSKIGNIALQALLDAYAPASVLINARQEGEPLSLDEAYLDVTENRRGIATATATAAEIRARILDETGLTASAGISYNKFLAKLASDHRKPNGQFVITPAMGPGFIEGLPVGKFHGIGPVTAAKMNSLGIVTGADLRCQSIAFLQLHFGKSGVWYYAIARGEDVRPVVPDRPRKSSGSETTFAEDLTDPIAIEAGVQAMADDVWAWCQKAQTFGHTVTVKIKFADFRQATRSRTLNVPVTSQAPLLETSGAEPGPSSGRTTHKRPACDP
jgi:chemotaxis methyl-accepting protein methylase